jgi:phosphatidylserine decarboxylase
MTSYLQYLLPHHLLSAIMHAIARIEWAPLKDFIISRVIDMYDVDLSSAREENPNNYPSFNAFFTRQLKAEARPVGSNGDGHKLFQGAAEKLFVAAAAISCGIMKGSEGSE